MGERVERSLARVTSADIGEVYNGMLGLRVCFEYEGGMHQCLSGYMLEAAMVVRVMRALGVMELGKAVGVSCWVTHTHDGIKAIEPLHAKDGIPFILADWQAWVRATLPPLAWIDLEGTRQPHHPAPTREVPE